MKSQFKTTRFALAFLALVAGAGSEAAAQFDITLSSAQFTTYVMVEQADADNHTADQFGHFNIWPWGISRTTVSPVPINDEIYGPESGLLNAQANADLFGVAAYSSIRFQDAVAGAHNATAGAESQIWFSPVTSGTANIGFDFIGQYLWQFSACALSLVDITADQTLWDYEWSDLGGPFPFDGSNEDGASTGMLSCLTDLNAGHSYALDMFVQTFADEDVELVSIQASGLHVVNAIPEPSTFALVSFGAAMLLASRQTHGVTPKKSHVS